MRVALLADVHANLHALEAVLAEVRAQACDEVWLAGDWVGYGAFPEETVAALTAAGAVGVRGDMDVEVLAAAVGELPEGAREAKRRSLEWTAARLSRDALGVLFELPEQRLARAAALGALIVHGSPAALDEHLWPDTDERRLRELARDAPAPIVVCGHTHRAMDREAGGARFLNPGSVGRPADGDPRASWGLLVAEEDGVRFSPRRVSYPHDAAAAAVRARGLPEPVALMFELGRGLGDVLDG